MSPPALAAQLDEPEEGFLLRATNSSGTVQTRVDNSNAHENTSGVEILIGVGEWNSELPVTPLDAGL